MKDYASSAAQHMSNDGKNAPRGKNEKREIGKGSHSASSATNRQQVSGRGGDGRISPGNDSGKGKKKKKSS